jgi:hypothetical protein
MYAEIVDLLQQLALRRALAEAYAHGVRYERRRRKQSCERRHNKNKGRCSCGSYCECPFLVGRKR